LLLAAIILLLLSSAALSASHISIIIPPGQDRFAVQPGSAVRGTLTLVHRGDQPEVARIAILDGSTNPAGGVSFNAREEGEPSSWFFLEKNNFLMQPGERLQVSFVLRVPPDALPGEYAGGFTMVDLYPSYSSDPRLNVRVVMQVVHSFVVAVQQGNARLARSLEIEDLGWEDGKAWVAIRNAGQTILAPMLTIHFEQNGQVVVERTEHVRHILPGDRIRVPVECRQEVSGRVLLRAMLAPREVSEGEYRAELSKEIVIAASPSGSDR
jgi:hypothetical protein